MNIVALNTGKHGSADNPILLDLLRLSCERFGHTLVLATDKDSVPKGKDTIFVEPPCVLANDPGRSKALNLVPANPHDDCTDATVIRFPGNRAKWMLDYCKNWLNLGSGITVKALPNSDESAVLENIRVNSRRGLQVLGELPPHEGHAVLVGGGPSLADSLDEIRMRQRDGQKIFALNGAAGFLDRNGIEVDCTVIMDAREDNIKFVDTSRGDQYLLASQCHTAVFEAAQGHSTLWHFAASDKIMAVLPETEAPPMLVQGGIVVGLTSMALVYMLGYRNIHLYGYDSSDREDVSHAYFQSENTAEKTRVEVWCAGQKFTSGIAMYAQAEAFPRWAQMLANEGVLITVHGEGLLPTVARNMLSAKPYQGDTK